MARTLLVLLASLTFACTTVRVMPPAPSVEVSGQWIGTWRAMDVTNVMREGQLTIDLMQDGSRGRGRMTWIDSGVTDVPHSARLAGAMGVPIVFAVTGSTIVLRHEAGARELAMTMTVQGDEIAGSVETASRVEVRATRLTRLGGATTTERLGRLELDATRERTRVGGIETRLTQLATDVQTVRAVADDAAGTAQRALVMAGESTTKTETTAALEDLERRVREASNGHATNGRHGERALLHTLDVRFAFNKADVDDAGMTALIDVIELLKENPELTAELEGYADAVGSADYNVRLSQRRVDAVYRYLAQRGVPLERMHVVGLGPLPDKDAEARAKNRRVTLKLMMAED